MPDRERFAFIQRHGLLILVCLVLGIAAGWGISARTTPTYKSQASAYFSLGLSKSATDLNQGSSYTQGQMVSFAKLATSPTVLQPVIDSLGLDETPRALAASLDVTTPPDSVIVQVAATDTSSERASIIANAVVRELTVAVSQVGPGRVDGEPSMSSRIIETAVPASQPASPNERVNLIAGGLLGLLGGILLGILLDKLYPRVRRAGDLAELTEAAIIGPVKPVKATMGTPLLLTARPAGPAADQYRAARLGLQNVLPDGPVILTVAAAAPSVKPTQLVENLAAAFAENDLNVLVIDADLRPGGQPPSGQRPSSGQRPPSGQLSPCGPGLADLLADPELGEETIHASGHGYDLLGPGTPVANPSQLVASRDLEVLLGRLRFSYDVILMKTPALGTATDAVQLGRRSDGLVLVVRCPGTRRRHVENALLAVHSAGVTLAAVLMAARPRPARGQGMPRTGVKAGGGSGPQRGGSGRLGSLRAENPQEDDAREQGVRKAGMKPPSARRIGTPNLRASHQGPPEAVAERSGAAMRRVDAAGRVTAP